MARYKSNSRAKCAKPPTSYRLEDPFSQALLVTFSARVVGSAVASSGGTGCGTSGWHETCSAFPQRLHIMIGTILLVLLVLLLLGALPAWPHSHSWGYAPSGALGTVLLVVLVLVLVGRL